MHGEEGCSLTSLLGSWVCTDPNLPLHLSLCSSTSQDAARHLDPGPGQRVPSGCFSETEDTEQAQVLLSPQEEPCLPDSALGPVSPPTEQLACWGCTGRGGGGRWGAADEKPPGLGGPGRALGTQGRWGLSGSQDTRLEDQ